MKLAFSTLGCPKWTLEQAIAMASKLGYDALEIRGLRGEMRIKQLSPFQAPYRAETKRMLADVGLSIVSIDTSVNFDKGYNPNLLDEAKRAIDICDDMGIPGIRVFGNRMSEGEAVNDALKRVEDGLFSILSHGGKARVLLETHGDYHSLTQFEHIISNLNDARFGVLWDVHHTNAEYGAHFDEFYMPLKAHIHHVHIKDARNGALCPVGEGTLPLTGIYKMLAREHFEGAVSLEWEKVWHPEIPEPETVFPAYVKWARALE